MIIDQVQSDNADADNRRLKQAAWISLSLLALLWLIWIADALFALQLVRFGVYPRDLMGLRGILFAPLIHGSAAHLLANTPSFFVLCTALLYGYPRSARIVLAVLYLGSGLGVWLFARESFHIGASGITHGLMFFIFVIGVLRRDRLAIVLSLIVFFLYGGMIWGVLPQQPHVSFESHFFGAVTGVALALLLRNRDPKQAVKRYDWEGEEDSDSEFFPGETRQDSAPGNDANDIEPRF